MNQSEILSELVKETDEHEKSLKLRLFIKENIDFVINNNLKDFFANNILYNSESYNVIVNFYNLINQKINLIFFLKKWKDIYINDLFWNLSTNDQIEFLNNLKTIFLSIYDCSQGGFVYHIKLMQIFNSNNYNYSQIMSDVEDRLKRILDLFGSNIFEYLKIPLITVRDLYKISHEEIIRYFTIIFKSINDLLKEIIVLFETFNSTCDELDNLLNPS
jgi:hypothetical protein